MSSAAVVIGALRVVIFSLQLLVSVGVFQLIPVYSGFLTGKDCFIMENRDQVSLMYIV